MRARTFAIAASVLVLAAGARAELAAVRVVYAPEVAVRADAPGWEKLPETTLPLSAQIIMPPNGGGSVSQVAVRAMHDGEWLAIRLEWQDASADRAVGSNTFRDAAAVGFPVGETDPPPSPFMGDEKSPVAIWQWTADMEANALGRGSFADRYPHTEGVWYFPQDSMVQREVRAWRGADPVVEYRAMGFGTLTRRSTRNVHGTSLHAEGRWQVVLRRRLASGDPEDPSFRPGEATKLITAVWNGGRDEVNGRKSVTLGWTPFVLDATVGADGRP